MCHSPSLLHFFQGSERGGFEGSASPKSSANIPSNSSFDSTPVSVSVCVSVCVGVCSEPVDVLPLCFVAVLAGVCVDIGKNSDSSSLSRPLPMLQERREEVIREERRRGYKRGEKRL